MHSHPHSVPNQAAAPQLAWNLFESFRALGEFRSLSIAAQYLDVPQAVLSHHISKLEASLGCVLTTQSAGHIELSNAGQKLLELVVEVSLLHEDTLNQGLKSLLPVLNSSVPAQKEHSLSIHLGLPGLASVLKLHTDRLMSFPQPLSFETHADMAEPNGVTFYFAPAPRDGLQSHRLFDEEIITVVSERYQVPDQGFNQDDLMGEALIQFEDAIPAMDWTTWFSGATTAPTDWENQRLNQTPFPSYATYLRAILSGRGVGVGLAPLFAPFLASGELKLASQRSIYGGNSCFVAFDPEAGMADTCRQFVDLIISIFEDQVRSEQGS